MNAITVGAAACVAGTCNPECFAGWVPGGTGCVPRPVSTKVTLAKSLNTPADLAVDADHVYWSDTGDSSIWRVQFDGTGREQLASGEDNPAFMAIDDANVYWVNQSLGAIRRVPKGGGDVTSFVTGMMPLGVAADGTNVYWVSEGTFYSVPKAGGSPVKLGTPTAQTGPGLLTNLGRLTAGLVFADGVKLWSPTGVVSGGAGPFVLGRDGGIIRAAGFYLGANSIATLPGGVDVSASCYFGGGGVACLRKGKPVLLVSVDTPRHIEVRGNEVFWTAGREVSKATICD